MIQDVHSPKRAGSGRRAPGRLPPPSTADLASVFLTQETRVETELGPRPLSALAPGDRVLTGRCDLVRIVSKRAFSLEGGLLHAHPELRPLYIPAGALGNKGRIGLSLLHPIALVEPVASELGLSVQAGIVRAKDLIGAVPGVAVADDRSRFGCVSLTLERQAYVLVEGIPVEMTGPDRLGPRPVVVIGSDAVAPDLAPTEYDTGRGILGPLLLGVVSCLVSGAGLIVAGFGLLAAMGIATLIANLVVVAMAVVIALRSRG
ncbi:Hint domain-containing protein [Jannaschia seohaensis]|uniref:Hint domain-containing protein n=1 Tax=Jannaschia seohaensis TaxID=475081 RepID=A0A2Y9AXM7_9RHOB|nr:Hint domain-containing protein [Jannaschia seohaensis]PWJ18294.1 Hint domain-containing protein [Jannaschia seohaensis]SSA46819.1 Hint domain-containing protein [Jannaschia seohaensis]